MLIQALTDQFNTHFQQYAHHDAVLWFDPGEEYAAVVARIEAYPVWCYEGSLLKLRYRLVHRAPGERVVVYLPLPETDAEVLRPFFATSYVFQESLYRFLRQQGFDFPDAAEVAHEVRALLPRLAARSLGKGRAFWTYNLANLERARETLLGNFDDTLLRFLAQPTATLQQLEREQLDGLFFAQLESTYGLAIPDEGPAADTSVRPLARQLAAQLALVHAFVDADRPEAFPYRAKLPPAMYFDRCRAFLDRWQRDSAFKSAYAQFAEELAPEYDLAGWSAQLPFETAAGVGGTFADVEASLWARAREALDALDDEAAWWAWLTARREAFAARARDFWAREGRAPWWEILVQAADLLALVREARADLDALTTPGAVLAQYVARWWRIDRTFRELRATLDRQPETYDALRERAALSYRDILSKMNDRFADLLGPSWPPKDVARADGVLPQDTFWAAVESARDRDQRVAVFYVDALRYELGQVLLEALDEEHAGQKRTLTARLAAVPTTTPIGMAAVLPYGDRRRVAYTTDWEVSIDEWGNLKDKPTRLRWLTRVLGDVNFYNLDTLLSTRADQIPRKAYTVVFDTTLDAVGENAGVQAWSTFSTLLQAIKKGVHKLLEAGVEHIHLVADHGFLLLDTVGEHEKISVRDVPALAKRDRYVVGEHLGTTDQLSYPVPGSETLRAWFPRGLGCFRTPGAYNYVHGGLALQELLVPHIMVEQQVHGKPVGVRVDLPAEIRNGQLKLVLHPIAESVFAQPRYVTLSLEKAGEPVVPPVTQVVQPGEAQSVSVQLMLGCGLEPGDRVRWVLRDARTAETLAEQDALNYLDFW